MRCARWAGGKTARSESSPHHGAGGEWKGRGAAGSRTSGSGAGVVPRAVGWGEHSVRAERTREGGSLGELAPPWRGRGVERKAGGPPALRQDGAVDRPHRNLSLVTFHFSLRPQGALELGAQLVGGRETQVVGGDADGMQQVGQGVFDHDAVAGLAQEQADGLAVGRGLDLAVDGGHVEAQLAGILGAESAGLEFDDDVAVEEQVVEEEVHFEFLAADVDPDGLADEGEPHAQLDQELGHPVGQELAELVFPGAPAGIEEAQVVSALEHVFGQIGVAGRHQAAEVADGTRGGRDGPEVDVVDEDVAGPAVGGGLFRIGQAVAAGLEVLEEGDLVVPRQLSKRRLDNFGAPPCFGKGAHVHEIRAGEARHVGEFGAKVAGHAVDDLRAPAVLFLLVEDAPSDVPIEGQLLGVGGQQCAQPGMADPLLDGEDPAFVVAVGGGGWRS